MIIVAGDPGEERGYAMVNAADIVVRASGDRPRVLEASHDLADLYRVLPSRAAAGRQRVFAVVEYQYAARIQKGEISATSIIRLAFRAGWMLRDMVAYLDPDEQFAVLPSQWKPLVFRSGANLTKEVFCRRVAEELNAEERALFGKIPRKNHDDVLDAIGMAWALAAADEERRHAWRVTKERIIPVVARKGR